MKENIELLNLRFINNTLSGMITYLDNLIGYKKPTSFFTISAELIVMAQEDKLLKEKYDNADILTIDSYVVYYAAKILGKNFKEPVSGSRVLLNFLPIAQRKEYKLYFLGATKEIVEKAVAKVTRDYPGINIVGWHDGYFGTEGETEVVQDIIAKKPDVLFVAMSSPLKEEFIYRNKSKMNVPVSIGVGGIFDIIAGKCKLAPSWVSKLGLEWLYRFVQEPRRMWRRYLITNLKFIMLVVKEIFKRSKPNV